MFEKRKYIFGILIISCLLVFTGCSVRKNVKIKEVKDFTESTLESNEKIKSLDFYFIRPYLGANLVYDGDLEEGELKDLVDEFKTLIDIDFMQRIGDKYWGGSRPNEFVLYVYVDEIKDNKHEHTYDYKIFSQYNKTFNSNEIPENIDGYKTWFGYNKITGESVINESEELDWGVELSTKDITPSGLTLICKQYNGKIEGKLEFSRNFSLEEKVNGQWRKLENISLIKGNKDKYITVTLDDAREVKEDKYILVPLDDVLEITIDWKDICGELKTGEYRLEIFFMDFINMGYYYTDNYFVYFEIK